MGLPISIAYEPNDVSGLFYKAIVFLASFLVFLRLLLFHVC